MTERRGSPAHERRGLLAEWKDGCTRKKRSHFEASQRLERRSLWLGIPVAIFSAAVGTATFASAQKLVQSQALLVVASVVSLLAAVLSALQTFLKLDAKAQAHKDAYAGYASIVTGIESLLAGDVTEADVSTVRTQLEALRRESPIPPEGGTT
jgi:hypothetical protein